MIESITEILTKRIKDKGLTRPIEATRVCEAYNAVIMNLNQKICEKSEALYLKNKTLVISVPSSALANELLMCQHLVVEGINEILEKRVVERIRYQIRR